MKKLYLGRNKKICGVCAGVGNYLNVDPTLIRIGFLTLAVFTVILPLVVVYFLLALVFPQAPDDYVETNTGRILTKGYDKKICGICSGYADYFGFDATVVRLIFAIFFLFVGGGLWLYLISLLLMPSFHVPEEFTQM